MKQENGFSNILKCTRVWFGLVQVFTCTGSTRICLRMPSQTLLPMPKWLKATPRDGNRILSSWFGRRLWRQSSTRRFLMFSLKEMKKNQNQTKRSRKTQITKAWRACTTLTQEELMAEEEAEKAGEAEEVRESTRRTGRTRQLVRLKPLGVRS